ncbi:hypothetical protein MMC22_003287 [Lobaria immixta]|nr:hypothetical protein [Lobaria immixta]
MLILKASNYFSFLCVLTPFFNAIFLTPFHKRISVFAADLDPKSDYPDDDEIRAAFLGVQKDKTVVFADLDPNEATEAEEFARKRGLTWIYEAFPKVDGKPYIFANGRPSEGYPDFIERVVKIWIKAASGIVYLVTNYPNGPRVILPCQMWWFLELPSLKDNEDVRLIIRIDRHNFLNWNVYLNKDDPDPFDPDKPNDGDVPLLPEDPDEYGTGGGMLGVGVGIGTGTGLMGGSLGTGLGIGAGADAGHNLVPGLYLPSSGREGSKDKTGDGEGVITDIPGNIVGFLPSLNLPDVIDEQQVIPETDVALDASGIFKRQARSACYDWSNERDFPTFPGDPRLTQYSLGVADTQYYDMAKGGWAVIKVTQYAKQFPLLRLSDDYKLDITILNPANDNQVLGSVIHANAPEGEPIKVASLLPFALFAWTGPGDADPLYFKYGEFGQVWNSNDKSDEHKCKLDPWITDQRQGTCLLHYG